MPTPPHLAVKLKAELIQSGSVISLPSGTGGVLLGRHWPAPVDEPEAVLVALHGIQTHSGWFGALAEEMNKHRWAVYAPDRDGSGLNMRTDANGMPRPYDAEHWTDWLKWLDALIGKVAALHPGAPLYLLGSSWSTALVSAYMDSVPVSADGWRGENPSLVSGLILSVPSGLASHLPSPLKKAAALLGNVAGLVIPPVRERSISVGIPAKAYSSDPMVQQLMGDVDIPLPSPEPVLKAGAQDPRIIHRASFRFLLQSGLLRRAGLKALARLRKVPLLVILTEVDEIADNDKLTTLLPSAHRVVIPGTQHAIQVERPDLLAQAVLDRMGRDGKGA
jgi:alpha-beta hydrolase superfamily lysophospholipase